MPRSAILHLVILASIGLVGCSKKQQPASPDTPPADSAQPAADLAGADGASLATREFDFTGRSSNTGPSSEASSVKPGQPEASPSETITVQMPVMLEYYPPFYPIADRMKGAEGKLLVALFVTETGLVEGPTIVSSTMPAYADEVLKAAAMWRFLPAMHEGKPLRFPVQIPVNFISEFGSGGMPPGSPLQDLVLLDDTFYVVGAEGKYTVANSNVTPLTRVAPIFELPENVTELRVVLQFKVTEQGRVVDPIVDQSSNSGFDQAALKAIRFWQFLPKIKDGKAVAASAKLPLSVTK